MTEVSFVIVKESRRGFTYPDLPQFFSHKSMTRTSIVTMIAARANTVTDHSKPICWTIRLPKVGPMKLLYELK